MHDPSAAGHQVKPDDQPLLPLSRDGATARQVAERCADVAGAILLAAATAPKAVGDKGATTGGRSDIVTTTDPAIERAVVEILGAAYPDHAVLGEETGAHAGAAAWL